MMGLVILIRILSITKIHLLRTVVSSCYLAKKMFKDIFANALDFQNVADWNGMCLAKVNDHDAKGRHF